MSTVYAESSAVLRWLLGTTDAPVLQEVLANARRVVSSALTSAEVARTLRRLVTAGAIGSEPADAAWAHYSRIKARWQVYAVTDAVLARASQPFPVEPVRTLDAIHLATATLFSAEVTPPIMLSVDRQLMWNAERLGLTVAPSDRA